MRLPPAGVERLLPSDQIKPSDQLKIASWNVNSIKVRAEQVIAWLKSRETDYQSGTLWKYAQTVGSAEKGAVTHPGAKAEKHVYADI